MKIRIIKEVGLNNPTLSTRRRVDVEDDDDRERLAIEACMPEENHRNIKFTVKIVGKDK